jgi:hypothetical protein
MLALFALHPEVGGTMFLRNAGKLIPDYMVSHLMNAPYLEDAAFLRCFLPGKLV